MAVSRRYLKHTFSSFYPFYEKNFTHKWIQFFQNRKQRANNQQPIHQILHVQNERINKNWFADNINAYNMNDCNVLRIFNWLPVDADPREKIREQNANIIYVMHIESQWSEILAGS